MTDEEQLFIVEDMRELLEEDRVPESYIRDQYAR